jgi:hypothetical protein
LRGKYHNLTAVLPQVIARLRAAEFSKQEDIANAYGIDHSSVTRWKSEAFKRGLIDAREWRRAICTGRLARELRAA